MCLMVYVGTQSIPPATDRTVLGFDEVDQANPVRQWFSLPHVSHVGVPAGNCSCAFRSVQSEELIDWYSAMWGDRNEEELAGDRAIVETLRSALLLDGQIELYAVWDGDESKEPVRRVDRDLSWLETERFFVQENMFYRVHSAPLSA